MDHARDRAGRLSVGMLPLAAELAWGTLRTGVVGPGFAAKEFATARVALEAAAGRWYEVVGVVGNLPVTTDARVAYHAAAPGQIFPAQLQIRLRSDPIEGCLLPGVAGRYVPIEQIGGSSIPGIIPGAAAFMLLVGVVAALGPATRPQD